MRDEKFAASISLVTLMCRLVTTDLTDSIDVAKDAGGLHVDLLAKGHHDFLLGQNDEMFMQIIQQMPPEIAEWALSQLFHERIHYWQIMSYPILQIRYLHQLELMRARVPLAKAFVIAGVNLGRATKPVKQAQAELDLIKSEINFLPEEVVVKAQRVIGDDHCHIQSGHTKVAGRLHPRSILRIRKADGSYVQLPLDASHLIEASVTLMEVIVGTKPLLQHDDLTPAELEYWGPWLLWKRVTRDLGLTETANALLFLAVVDLAMSADASWYLTPNQSDVPDPNGRLVENLTISHRFARLCVAVSRIGEELRAELEGTTEDERYKGVSLTGLVNAQRLLATAAGMATMFETYARSLVRLSLIVGQYLLMLDPGKAEKGKAAARRLRQLPASSWRDGVDDARLIWQTISSADGKPLFQIMGFPTIAAICNFQISRLDSPVVHVVPFLCVRDLTVRFPLPLINLSGALFTDCVPVSEQSLPSVSGMWDEAINVWPSELGQDLTILTALAPFLEMGDLRGCGFLRRAKPACTYSAAGLGCPVAGLNDQQRARRAETNIGEGCHRYYAMRKAGLTAPPAKPSLSTVGGY